ncbi:MAG: hypothetical protein ACE5FF_15655 [Saprospiraceae bacterium]
MNLEFGLTDDFINTQYAPLAALFAHYQQAHLLGALEKVDLEMKTRDYSPVCKLKQVLVSILAGCETLTAFNTQLDSEAGLAAIWGWERFAEQSTLSRTLDALTLMNIEQLRTATTAIWRFISRTRQHDWRGFLLLDFDLSGLPCSPRAEASQKGYFSGKKTSPVVS